MDSTGKIAKKIISNSDIVFLMYAIKRVIHTPVKYNKIVYAVLCSIMLTFSLRWSDAISAKYRNFLIRFTFAEIKHPWTSTSTFDGCETHHRLSDTPPETSCLKLAFQNIPLTYYRIFVLYFRFYLVQLAITSSVRRKLSLPQIEQTLLSIVRSTLFLAGQTSTTRIILCLEDHFGFKHNYFMAWLAGFLGTTWVACERSDRVGQINNLVLAHIVIGWLRKLQLLNPVVTIPAFMGAVAKEKRVDPIALIFAMLTTLTF
eukprot:Phypoly_transcript_08323.p1 GENE.Phypoly_transcript_08323~~Phypoly_transcript_08323.p1  ORF type:complete len:259 (+),score=17.25 Phypoly_transcript_08323:730-1506(+)